MNSCVIGEDDLGQDFIPSAKAFCIDNFLKTFFDRLIESLADSVACGVIGASTNFIDSPHFTHIVEHPGLKIGSLIGQESPKGSINQQPMLENCAADCSCRLILECNGYAVSSEGLYYH